MGAYFSIAALALCLFVDVKHKLTAKLLACEFFAMWAIHYFGYTVFGVLGEPELYLTYILAQMPILFFMWLTHCSLYVRWLITISLVYNVLTISQYSLNVIEFYGNYKIFMQVIMVLQLAFLVWANRYVTVYRRSKKPNHISNGYKLFNIRPRMGVRGKV
jgi:hypothetical protein